MRDGTITVVIPTYNEENNISAVSEAVKKELSEAGISYRVLFVDDGSQDASWERIRELTEADQHITGLRLSRNFGKESAIFAGICNCDSECCAVMDADLQHPPETLVEMFRLWQEGFDVIEGIKSERGNEKVLKKKSANLFYRIICRVTGLELKNTSDFKLLDRRAVQVIQKLPERSTFFRAMSFWVGFNTTNVEYRVGERATGSSKWSTGKLMKYAINNVAAFSTAPMQIVTWLGALSVLLGSVFGIISIVQKFMGIALNGFTTVIVLIAIIGGIIMVSLGIIGFYIARIYSEVQHRPRFIIQDVCGVDDKNTNLVG